MCIRDRFMRHRCRDLCSGRYSLRLSISFRGGSDFTLNEHGTRSDWRTGQGWHVCYVSVFVREYTCVYILLRQIVTCKSGSARWFCFLSWVPIIYKLCLVVHVFSFSSLFFKVLLFCPPGLISPPCPPSFLPFLKGGVGKKAPRDQKNASQKNVKSQ